MLIFNGFGNSLPTPKTIAQLDIRAMSLYFPLRNNNTLDLSV